MQKQRKEADRERQVESSVLTREARIDGADIALKKQRLRIEVEFVVELAVTIAATELEAREFRAVLKRREEGMDAFCCRQLEIDIEIQPRRDLRDVLAVVTIVGHRRPPIAVDGEARQQRVQFPEERTALVVNP